MAAQHHQPGTNNRLSFGGNSFMVGKGTAAMAAGSNNHVKKPSQGKKIVIKNRKGEAVEGELKVVKEGSYNRDIHVHVIDRIWQVEK